MTPLDAVDAELAELREEWLAAMLREDREREVVLMAAINEALEKRLTVAARIT